jgi:plastocyanin
MLRVGAMLAVGALLVVACRGATTVRPEFPTPSAAASVPPSAPASVPASSIPSAPAVGTQVDMTDGLRFAPETLTIRSGQSITFVTTGLVGHTVTDDPTLAADPSHSVLPPGAAAWDSGFVLPGQSYQLTLTVPGTYKLFCIPHESVNMVMTITVEQ